MQSIYTSYKLPVLMVSAIVLFMVTLFLTYGYENTWQLWGIGTISPHFGDLRAITYSGESIRQGFDPMIENPANPWNTTMNYPRVWQSIILLTGINHTHTTYLGILIITLFLVGICLLLRNANLRSVLFVGAAVLSPACLLGAERGNVDLLMFFVVAVSLAVIRGSSLLSAILSAITLFIGFLLKLFPIFGLTLLLRAGKLRFIVLTLLLVTAVGSYLAITYPDILNIRLATPKGVDASFGINVAWGWASNHLTLIAKPLKWLAYLSLLIIFIVGLSALFRNDHNSSLADDDTVIDAFRAGATIYIGTFIIGGNNYDYRLIFLIFTIPQLLVWAKSSARYIGFIGKASLVNVFLALWHLLIWQFSGKLLPYGYGIALMFDEIITWLLLAFFTYLLLWSVPPWLKIKPSSTG